MFCVAPRSLYNFGRLTSLKNSFQSILSFLIVFELTSEQGLPMFSLNSQFSLQHTHTFRNDFAFLLIMRMTNTGEGFKL